MKEVFLMRKNLPILILLFLLLIGSLLTIKFINPTQSLKENKVSYKNALIGELMDYNVLVLNDFKTEGLECHGNMAVGKEIKAITDYNVYGSKKIEGNEITGNLYKDDITNAEDMTSFNNIFNELTSLSQQLAKVKANGIVKNDDNFGDQIDFIGTDNNINIFTITADQYNDLVLKTNGRLAFNFDVPDKAKVIVNIIGQEDVNLAVKSAVMYAGSVVSNDTENNKYILFNIPEAKTVLISSSIGNVLAPSSQIKSVIGEDYVYFSGQIICSSYEGVNNFGSQTFIMKVDDIWKLINDKSESVPNLDSKKDIVVPEVKDEEKVENPKTGDISSFLIMISLGLGILIIVLNKRKKMII